MRRGAARRLPGPVPPGFRPRPAPRVPGLTPPARPSAPAASAPALLGNGSQMPNIIPSPYPFLLISHAINIRIKYNNLIYSSHLVDILIMIY